jgi:hypothetical protein
MRPDAGLAVLTMPTIIRQRCNSVHKTLVPYRATHWRIWRTLTTMKDFVAALLGKCGQSLSGTLLIFQLSPFNVSLRLGS